MALVIQNNLRVLKRIIVIITVVCTFLIATGIFLTLVKPTNAMVGGADAYSIAMDEVSEGRQIMNLHVSDTGETYASYKDADDNSMRLYHFDTAQQLVSTITILPCELGSSNVYSTTGIVTDEAGAVYVSLNPITDTDGAFDDSCVRKYTTAGQEVADFQNATAGVGTFYTNIFIDYSGAVAIISRTDPVSNEGSVLRFSAANGLPLGDVLGGVQSITQSIGSPVASYDGNWFVLQPNAIGVNVKVYDASGVYVRSITDTSHGGLADGVTVSSDDLLYVADRYEGVIHFTLDGTFLGNGRPIPDNFNFSNPEVLSPKGKYLAFYNQTDSKIYGAKVVVGPIFAPIVTVASISNTSVVLRVESNPLEIADPAGFNLVYLSGDENGVQRQGTIQQVGAVTEVTFDDLTPNTVHSFYSQYTNTLGQASATGFITFLTTGAAPSSISTATTYIDENDGKNILKIDGVGFGSYLTSMSTSKVNLNGIALPFCLDGTGATYEIYLSFGYPAEMIGESPPCYFLMRGSDLVFGSTSVMIWLPDDFNMSSPGTVSVNGSPAFTFNGGVVTPPVQPTIETDNGATLNNTPTLPSKPVFTGVAEPFATVKVTIHSDPVECTTTAASDGRWRCEFATALPSGIHTVHVQITNTDNTVTNLGPYPIAIVAEQSTSQPGRNNTHTNRNNVAYVTDDEVVVSDAIDDSINPLKEVNENNTSQQNVDDADVVDVQPQDAQNGIWWIVGSVAAIALVGGVVFIVRKALK